MWMSTRSNIIVQPQTVNLNEPYYLLGIVYYAPVTNDIAFTIRATDNVCVTLNYSFDVKLVELLVGEKLLLYGEKLLYSPDLIR